MVRKLFPESRHPKGHPTVAITLTYLAEAHRAAGDSTAALRTLEEMLAIQRRLATDAKPGTGQHGLFLALNNLAHSYVELRQFDRARPLLTESLAELERLFPKTSFPHGHLYLVTTHLSLGMIAHAKGDSSTARDHLRLAAEMQRSLTEQVIATLSEAEALAWLWAQPVVRDSLLSLSASDPAWNTAVYGMVWNARAPLTRVLQRRHAAARLAASGKAGELNNLRDLRRQTERLLQDTKTARDQRDQTLARLADEQDQLERRLAAVLPEIELWRRREAIGPTDLAAALPAGTVFVDIQTYFRFEPGVPWSGVGRPKIPQHYVAFVVAKGSPPRRIELGPIQPIETAVSQWLRAIVESQPGDAATKVSKIVWEPIALALPADTKTIYISPDGMLARIPWAAIPTGENRILLDDRAVATVPHGPFLAGELRFPRDQHPSADGLTVGGVDFTGSVLPPLPGTTLELKVIAGLATSPPTRLTAADATSQRVANALPSAGWAHLATHGFFAESEFTTERAHAETVAKSGESGRTGPRRVAARNPLGFVGLVLAHGEVLSGLRIVDLKLDNLRLVTLSACETGLGELTGGEGVQGLQRAFHLAGCPNVVASLWKVNDAATAALMTKFYHEMWVNKKPPIEALREAQLTIYRHPELIPELTGERGAVKLKEAVAIQSTAAPRANGKHSDTKLWAAFVLSGVGK